MYYSQGNGLRALKWVSLKCNYCLLYTFWLLHFPLVGSSGDESEHERPLATVNIRNVAGSCNRCYLSQFIIHNTDKLWFLLSVLHFAAAIQTNKRGWREKYGRNGGKKGLTALDETDGRKEKRRKTREAWQEEDGDRRGWARDERWRRRQELKDGGQEVKEMACGGEEGRERGKEWERRERLPLYQQIRGRNGWILLADEPPPASYLLWLHELRTHFIEICEIRKGVYRLIDHRPTPDHTSSPLHNKIHNWHFFFFFWVAC